MRCPRCNHNNSRVIDSRQTDDGRAIRRRRECESCGFRFTTFERIEAAPLLVVKRNGDREEFSRDKILRGLIRSEVDEIAYIRFASVYRQFKDMSVFLKELQEIVDKAKSTDEE